ncbi:MAG: hypothetical protein OXG09_02375 [Chloroflexi bacterium]|nr:hypothetical protein [Chloroflexota bacterium]
MLHRRLAVLLLLTLVGLAGPVKAQSCETQYIPSHIVDGLDYIHQVASFGFGVAEAVPNEELFSFSDNYVIGLFQLPAAGVYQVFFFPYNQGSTAAAEFTMFDSIEMKVHEASCSPVTFADGLQGTIVTQCPAEITFKADTDATHLAWIIFSLDDVDRSHCVPNPRQQT